DAAWPGVRCGAGGDLPCYLGVQYRLSPRDLPQFTLELDEFRVIETRQIHAVALAHEGRGPGESRGLEGHDSTQSEGSDMEGRKGKSVDNYDAKNGSRWRRPSGSSSTGCAATTAVTGSGP